jgi:hypothetical protein
LRYVLRDALASVVHVAEGNLCHCMRLVCRKPEQPSRLSFILRDALSLNVHLTEAVLRRCISLVCREPEQPSRLR